MELNRLTNPETNGATDHPSPPDSTRLNGRDWGVVLAAGLVLTGLAAGTGWWAAGRTSRGAVKIPEAERRLTHFILTERSGRTVTSADLYGQFLVVSFPFTSCTLSCRVVNERMAELQHALRDASDVRLVSFTLDPRTDTPPVLSRFAARYNAAPDRWWFLTGDKAEVYRVIETSFLGRKRELESLFPGGFEDADHLALVDRSGRVRGLVNGTRPDAVDRVLALLDRLRAESVALR